MGSVLVIGGGVSLKGIMRPFSFIHSLEADGLSYLVQAPTILCQYKSKEWN